MSIKQMLERLISEEEMLIRQHQDRLEYLRSELKKTKCECDPLKQDLTKPWPKECLE